ncbi:MAG: AMP-binding protein [Chloroflexi bacterium]|nr:MAG: AMP-binding protein [Chloroflexota bacterium]
MAGDPLLKITIGDLLDQRASEFPEQEALVYACYPEYKDTLELRWTYQQYRNRANEVARGLMALGLQKGEHIAVWATNLPEWPLLQMAAAKAGLVLVTINPAHRATELEYVLKQGDVSALFFMARVRDQDCLATVRSLITADVHNGKVSSERLPILRYVCLLGSGDMHTSPSQDWRPTLFRELVAGGGTVSEEELQERQASVKPTDPAMILHTSGTTGFPKGTVLTHRSIINNAIIYATRVGVSGSDRLCTALPLFHVGGSVLGTLGALSIGSTLYPIIAFDPLKMLQIISTERCTFLGVVPTMLLAMIQHPQFAEYDLSSLCTIIIGGAPVPTFLMEQVKEAMGTNIVIIYGQTEASAVITSTSPDDTFTLKSTTVGIPLPYVDVAIIDPATRHILPCGEQGELCCRGYLVMQGYYNMPEQTAEAIDHDNWLHTGDLAVMDQHGYIKIVGRSKEMVIRGGENIFPREIEELLIRHPQVADAQVLGVPDKFFGEELLAVLRLQEGSTLTEEELREYCKGQISHQKIPRYFQFVDAYPMTASGKVQKFMLRKNAIEALGLEDNTTA